MERQPFLLIGSPGSLPPGDELALADLHGLRLVTTPRGSTIRTAIDRMLADGLDARIVAELGHRTSILPTVMGGAGVTLLPSAWRRSATGGGAEVRTVHPTTTLHITALSRKSGLTPAASAFLDIAAAHARAARA